MRRLLVAVLAAEMALGLLMTGTERAGAAPPTRPTAAQAAGDAEAAYDQATALMIIRTLGLDASQLQGLLPVLQANAQQRGAYQAQRVALWGQSGPAIEAALSAALTNQPLPPSASAAQDALATASQAEISQAQAYDSLVQQWVASLAPAQAALVETPAQAAQRESAQTLLGGASSPGEYLALVADALRSLDPQTYQSVMYWEAQRLVSALSAFVPVNNPQLAAQQLRNMYDLLENMPAATYSSQRLQLATLISQQLGLPAALAPAGPVFNLDETRLLFSSDQALAVIQQLLQQTPSPLPVEDAAAGTALQDLGEAVVQWRTLGLVNTLQLTAGQVRQIQPFVSQAGQRRQGLEQSERSAQQAAQAGLTNLVQDLLTAPTLPLDAASRWNTVEQPMLAARAAARQEMTALLARIPQYLSQAQVNQIDWPVGGGQGAAAVQAELRQVAGEMARGRQFFDEMRRLLANMYVRMRLSRTRELIARYMPPGSPEAQNAERGVLDLLDRAKIVPREDWDQAAPELVTELMTGLGALPNPSAGTGAVNRPLAWEGVYDTLTDPAAGGALLRLAQSQPEG